MKNFVSLRPIWAWVVLIAIVVAAMGAGSWWLGAGMNLVALGVVITVACSPFAVYLKVTYESADRERDRIALTRMLKQEMRSVFLFVDNSKRVEFAEEVLAKPPEWNENGTVKVPSSYHYRKPDPKSDFPIYYGNLTKLDRLSADDFEVVRTFYPEVERLMLEFWSWPGRFRDVIERNKAIRQAIGDYQQLKRDTAAFLQDDHA